MSSANEDLAAGLIRYYGTELGYVVDNKDPLKLHRVRVSIPNLIESSAWALPRTMGGGNKGRGSSQVPAIGSLVYVDFIGGDVERPVYSGGPPTIPDSGPETSEEIQAAGNDAEKVSIIHESDRLLVWVDERDGKQQLLVRDKQIEDGPQIQIDLVSGVVRIAALSLLTLESVGAVVIDGASVTINGRIVLAGGGPI